MADVVREELLTQSLSERSEISQRHSSGAVERESQEIGKNG